MRVHEGGESWVRMGFAVAIAGWLLASALPAAAQDRSSEDDLAVVKRGVQSARYEPRKGAGGQRGRRVPRRRPAAVAQGAGGRERRQAGPRSPSTCPWPWCAPSVTTFRWTWGRGGFGCPRSSRPSKPAVSRSFRWTTSSPACGYGWSEDNGCPPAPDGARACGAVLQGLNDSIRLGTPLAVVRRDGLLRRKDMTNLARVAGLSLLVAAVGPRRSRRGGGRTPALPRLRTPLRRPLQPWLTTRWLRLRTRLRIPPWVRVRAPRLRASLQPLLPPRLLLRLRLRIRARLLRPRLLLRRAPAAPPLLPEAQVRDLPAVLSVSSAGRSSRACDGPARTARSGVRTTMRRHLPSRRAFDDT